MKISVYSPTSPPDREVAQAIVDFLYKNLQEYGDERTAINKCLQYAVSSEAGKGGFVVVSQQKDVVTGVVIINHTGMSDYIPENILVYIATHKNYRGQGIGKQLMQTTINTAEGDIALHVEKNNPAIRLYEQFGFTTPYLEMRLKR